MDALVCPFCSGIVDIENGGDFGKCKYCRRTFSMKNAKDMASASDADKENVVNWRKELMRCLDTVERSLKRRDYSDVKHFALKILTVLPGDFSSRYFAALCDYKSGNDAPYIDFLDVCDISRAGSEEIELVSGKIIDYAEKKHEAHIKGYFAKVYGTNAFIYNARLDKAIADGIEKLRRTGVRDCDLFICHSSADADEAKKLVYALENAGLTCWLSEINLLPGTQNYEEELAGAIAHCRMMLFLSSANSIYSKECEKELRMANADGKLFFVVKLDKEPFYGTSRNVLSSVQWLNAFDGVTPHCDEIASEIKMAFEDDAKEKAELERRALEARKRAEENSAKQSNNIGSAVNSDNSDVFLVQLEALCQNGKINTKEAEKIIDDGLRANPKNPSLWLWKFNLSIFSNNEDISGVIKTGIKNDIAVAVQKEYERFMNTVNSGEYNYLRIDMQYIISWEIEAITSYKVDQYVDSMISLRAVSIKEYGFLKCAVLHKRCLDNVYYQKAYAESNEENRKILDDRNKAAVDRFLRLQAELKKGIIVEAISSVNKRIADLLSQQVTEINREIDQCEIELKTKKEQSEKIYYGMDLEKKQHRKKMIKYSIFSSLSLILAIAGLIFSIGLIGSHSIYVPFTVYLIPAAIGCIVLGVIFVDKGVKEVKSQKEYNLKNKKLIEGNTAEALSLADEILQKESKVLNIRQLREEFNKNRSN